MLLRNDGPDANGAPVFSDVAMATGADDIRDARGMATLDFDNDGDLDVVVNNNPGDSGRAELARATLLRNNVGERRNWLAVELRSPGKNSHAVGAQVTLEVGGEKQVRLVSAGSGFASQHSERLYFGLGDHDRADAFVVHWPSGRVERVEQVGGQPIAARRLVRLTEGTGSELLELPAGPKEK